LGLHARAMRAQSPRSATTGSISAWSRSTLAFDSSAASRNAAAPARSFSFSANYLIMQNP